MAAKQIGIADIQPTERQWAQNFVIGFDGYNKLALMPLKRPVAPAIAPEWGNYVDTFTNKIYQIDVYEYHLVYKDEIQTMEHQGQTGKKFRKALYEKTLQGEAWIFLFADSTLGYATASGEREIQTSDIYLEAVDIIYAFNRLVIASSEVVYWSSPGLRTDTPPSPLPPGTIYINGAANRKQSDVITKDYLGLYTDFEQLYLITRGGIEIWRPTQDMDNPFIYSTAMYCRIADFDNQYAMLETDEHHLGLFNILSKEFATDDRWHIEHGNIADMKSFWLPQNGNKMAAIYTEDGAMWLYDLRHKLMTKITEPFYPNSDFGEDCLDSQIMLLVDKGVHGSLYIQLGQFPEEIQFYMDNFYMKRAPLLAFERDDVIKTANIGKLTVDTPLELNFKGYTAIYSVGIN